MSFIQLDERTVGGAPMHRCDACGWLVGGTPPPRCKCEARRPPCPHRSVEAIGSVPCGCGGRDQTVSVYRCALFEVCTECQSGKVQQWEGKWRTITGCRGCRSRPAFPGNAAE